MRLLPSGSAAWLVELDSLDEVLALYAALTEDRLDGVVDLVPAGRTMLVVLDPEATDLETVERGVRSARPRYNQQTTSELVEIPVSYDGEDLDDVASVLGCSAKEVVRQHTADEWTVAFGGFVPGFGYLTNANLDWDIPRRSSPRTKVPRGSVGLAGEFSGVYPSASPGGWQLIGRTELTIFDVQRDPPALLRPATRVRFVDASRR